jgi:hypothetical protein
MSRLAGGLRIIGWRGLMDKSKLMMLLPSGAAVSSQAHTVELGGGTISFVSGGDTQAARDDGRVICATRFAR